MSRAVIDQPGIRVVAVGLAISLFLGLALRTQISDTRLKCYLNKAIQRLQKDFILDYEKANVNLSKWGLPFPVLEISNIRMSPKTQNCRNSQIYVDEIEIPISVSTLFGLSSKVPKIRLKNVELRVDEQDNCFSGAKPSTAEPVKKESVITNTETQVQVVSSVVTAEQPQSAGGGVNEVFQRNTKAELSEVYIEKLKLIFSKKPEQPLVLKQVNVKLDYAEKKLSGLTIKSRVNAIKDSRSDIYFVNADFNLMAKPLEDGHVDVIGSIDGKLLDGDVQLFVHHITGNPKLTFELGVDKVSAKALFPLISSDYQKSTSFAQKVPMSVSFKNTGEAFLGAAPRVESTFKKLLFNIENSSVRASEVTLVYVENKLIVKPFEILIDSLPLSKFKNSDIFTGRLDSFESLGVVSGRIVYKDENNVEFDGMLKNLEVVFSNRGRRDFQLIDEINFSLKRRAQVYSLDTHSLVVNSEKVGGILSASHNLNDSSTSAYMKLTGLVLNKKVWEQFTFVEQSPKLNLNWVFKRGQVETHDLKLNADSIELPGVLFSNLSVDIKQLVAADLEKSNLAVQIKPLKILTNQKLFDNSYVNTAIDGSLGLSNQSFTSDKLSISMNGYNWQNLNFNLDAYLIETQQKQPLHVVLKGSTDRSKGLDSRLLISFKNKDYRFNFTTLNNELSLKPAGQ
jgi:hypothetical protein